MIAQEIRHFILLEKRLVYYLAIMAGDGKKRLIATLHLDSLSLVFQTQREIEGCLWVWRALQSDLLVGVQQFRIQHRGDLNDCTGYFLKKGFAVENEHDLDIEVKEPFLADVVSQRGRETDFFIESNLVFGLGQLEGVWGGNGAIFVPQFKA